MGIHGGQAARAGVGEWALDGLEPRSVRKKMKDKAFARSVNRDDIIRGAQELGVDPDEHIAFCIRAMEDAAERLGL